MSRPSKDHRRQRRVEFFVVSDHHERIPVWVFKPADAIDATAGLVTNLSDGGVQVLTASDEPLDGETYEIQLLLGEDETVARFRGQVTRVWTREAISTGRLNGFRFEDECSSAQDFIRVYRARASRNLFVRCLLMPRRSSL